MIEDGYKPRVVIAAKNSGRRWKTLLSKHDDESLRFAILGSTGSAVNDLL